MEMTSARTRSPVILLCLWLRACRCVHAQGGLGALLLVRAVTLKNHIGLFTGSRSGGTKGDGAPPRRREESLNSHERVIRSRIRSSKHHLKFDPTRISRGGSSMSGKAKGKEDKDHATKGEDWWNLPLSSVLELEESREAAQSGVSFTGDWK